MLLLVLIRIQLSSQSLLKKEPCGIDKIQWI
jgi:hypothetical protein